MAVFVYIVIFVFSVIIHEVAHGYVAYLRGDDTAKMSGRITLNPISHIELFGSIILPVMLLLMKANILFGWAKPVPLDYRKLKNPKSDIPLVSLAGPASNMLLVFFSSLAVRFIKSFPNFESGFGGSIEYFLYKMIEVNAVLSIVNILPIPPLDGSKVITYFLPRAVEGKIFKFESVYLFDNIVCRTIVGYGAERYIFNRKFFCDYFERNDFLKKIRTERII